MDAAGEEATHPLGAFKKSLETALGMTFAGNRGEQFFRSTLVRTLFYGMFASWVLRHEAATAQDVPFDWRTAAYGLHVPMVSALFEQITLPGKLKALELAPVLDWAADALNRVDVEAFDPELRKQLGVWYTPEEIVRYQVARVDHLLQTELGLPDGLADPNVVVLDPCCGSLGSRATKGCRDIANQPTMPVNQVLIAQHTAQHATEHRGRQGLRQQADALCLHVTNAVALLQNRAAVEVNPGVFVQHAAGLGW